MKMQFAISCVLLAAANTVSAGVLDNLDQSVEASTNKRALERLDSNINSANLNADYMAISSDLKQCQLEGQQQYDLLDLELHGARTQQAIRSLKGVQKFGETVFNIETAGMLETIESVKGLAHQGAIAGLNAIESKLLNSLAKVASNTNVTSCMETLTIFTAHKFKKDGFADCDQATQSLSENIVKVSKQVADYQAQLKQLDSSDALKAKNLELNGGCTLAECQTDEAKREISLAKKQLWARISDDDRIVDKLKALEHNIEYAEKAAKAVTDLDQSNLDFRISRFEWQKAALENAKSNLDSLLAISQAKADIFSHALDISSAQLQEAIDGVKYLQKDRVTSLKSAQFNAGETIRRCGNDLRGLQRASWTNKSLAKYIADYKARFPAQDGENSPPVTDLPPPTAAATEAPQL